MYIHYTYLHRFQTNNLCVNAYRYYNIAYQKNNNNKKEYMNDSKNKI